MYFFPRTPSFLTPKLSSIEYYFLFVEIFKVLIICYFLVTKGSPIY